MSGLPLSAIKELRSLYNYKGIRTFPNSASHHLPVVSKLAITTRRSMFSPKSRMLRLDHIFPTPSLRLLDFGPDTFPIPWRMLHKRRTQLLKPLRKLKFVFLARSLAIAITTRQHHPQLPNRHLPRLKKRTNPVQQLKIRLIDPMTRMHMHHKRKRLDPLQHRPEGL